MRWRLTALVALSLLACSEVTGPRTPAASIQAPDSLVLLEGDTVRLTATLLDSAGNPIAIPVAWTSEDTMVASVSPEGLVRFKQPGRTALLALGAGLVRRVPLRTAVRFTDVFPNDPYGSITWCAISTSGAAWCYRIDAAFSIHLDSVFRLRTPGGKAATFLSIHSEHECGLLSDGTPVCWPFGNTGLLGDPAAPVTTPIDSAVTPIVSGPFISLASSYGHTCGIATGGAAWCWGYNYGRPDPYGDLHPGSVLGTGDTSRFLALAPLQVSGGVHFSAIAAGIQHTCALDQSGNAWCWGSNLYGQLGAGALAPAGPSNSAVPARVAGTQTYTAIASGGYHTCALAQDGTAWCWGDLPGTPVPCRASCSAAPRQISTTSFVSITAGGDNLGDALSCGLTSGGTGYCWGDNVAGEVGDGTTTLRISPVPANIGQPLRRLRAGTYGACGVTISGDGYCWGGGRLAPARMPFQP